VPPRVLHVGGGPDEFLRIFTDPARLKLRAVARASFPEPIRDPACVSWSRASTRSPRARGGDLAHGGPTEEERTRRGLEEGSPGVRPGTIRGRVTSATAPTSRGFRQPSRRPTGPASVRAPGAASSTLSNGGAHRAHERVLDMRARCRVPVLGASSCAAGTPCACARALVAFTGRRADPRSVSRRASPRMLPDAFRVGPARSA